MLQFPPPVAEETSSGGFYDLDRAARLALVPCSTLAHWVAAGVVTPSRRIVAPDNRIVAEGFSFADLGYLHLLRHLRKHDVPLEDAVRFLVSAFSRFGSPGPKWKDARVFLEGSGKRRRVYLHLPDEYETTLAKPDHASQRVIDTFLGEAFIKLRERADSVLIPPDLLDDIEIDPRVADGMPVVAGTRIETAVVRDLARTMPEKRIVEMFPFLRRKQIRSAVRYEESLDKRAA